MSTGTETKVTEWGNSLGVRISRRDAARAGLVQGSRVVVKALPGRITLVVDARPKKTDIPQYSLKKLLRGITPKKVARDDVFLNAPPIGRETI